MTHSLRHVASLIVAAARPAAGSRQLPL